MTKMVKMKIMIYLFLGGLVIGLIAIRPIARVQAEETIFKYGVTSTPQTLDPHQAWDSASIDRIDQVMEGLLEYNLTDPECTIIPKLAVDLGTWSTDAREITFSLRQGVTFHDETPFNASAVKYSFDRLNNLINLHKAQIAELYEPLAQIYPAYPLVINRTEILGDYQVKFVLNYPYAAFTALLCFSGSYIIHPNMPFDRMIFLNETLIGTGPYVLESYTTVETHFTAYENYWREQPEIQEMIWIYYADSIHSQEALLAGNVHMVEGITTDFLDEYVANPNIFVHPPQVGATIQYLGMNNKQINQTIRQAISYAVDYNYIIATIMGGAAVRMVSPIPLGLKFHDPTVQPASYNLTIARQILVDAGLNKGLTPSSTDVTWSNLAAQNPIVTLNYSYNIGNKVRTALGESIATSLAKIGIRVFVIGMTWQVYLQCMLGEFDRLQLYMIGWMPDYNDPVNIINPLLSNVSLSNNAQVNDPWLQSAMMNVLSITSETERRAQYSAIQHYIVEELMPWCFLFQSTYRKVHNNALGNYPLNIMGKLDFYACTWSGITNTTTTTTTNTTTTTTTNTTTTTTTNTTTTTTTTSTSSTTSSDTQSSTQPTSPFRISGNLSIIIISLLCVSIALYYTARRKYRFL